MRKYILERGAARSTALSVVALAAALIVTSCGGGDADDASADALGATKSRLSAVSAGSASCDTRVNNTHAKLLECVTLEGVRAHQATPTAASVPRVHRVTTRV
jgi:aminopeptidase Y